MLLCAVAGQVEPQVPDDGQNLTNLRFRATVYQVMLANDRVPDLDAHALAALAGSPAKFQRSLADFGTLKVWSHVDQSIQLDEGNRIQDQSELPIISSIANLKADIVTVSFRQVNVGVTYEVNSSWPDGKAGGKVRLRLVTKLQGARPFEIKVADANPQFDVNECQLTCARTVALDRPLVLVSAAGDLRDSGEVCAYVIRIVLSDPT